MRVSYCCDADKRAYEQYYVGQSGNGLPVFYGSRTQRGHGIGSLFSGLFRSIFPILKRVAPIVGKKALETGMQIFGDVSSGQSFKESAKTRVLDALQDGINKIIPTEQSQSGSGIRRGKQKKKSKHSQVKEKRRKIKSDIFS